MKFIGKASVLDSLFGLICFSCFLFFTVVVFSYRLIEEICSSEILPVDHVLV